LNTDRELTAFVERFIGLFDGHRRPGILPGISAEKG
jgi:hypothetical protein